MYGTYETVKPSPVLILALSETRKEEHTHNIIKSNISKLARLAHISKAKSSKTSPYLPMKQGLAIKSCIGVVSWRQYSYKNGVFGSHSLVKYTSGLLRAHNPDSCSRLQEQLLTDVQNGASDYSRF